MSPEARRRLLHAASGGLVVLAPVTSWSVLRIVLAGTAALAVLLEFARLHKSAVNEMVRRVVPVYRMRERTQPSGAMWLAVGYALAALAAPPAPAAGILVAAIADPAASLAGSWRGHRRGGGKTLRGTVVHWLVAVGILTVLGWSWSAVVLGASVASLVERWPLGLDDNLLVPPATSLAVMLAT